MLMTMNKKDLPNCLDSSILSDSQELNGVTFLVGSRGKTSDDHSCQKDVRDNHHPHSYDYSCHKDDRDNHHPQSDDHSCHKDDRDNHHPHSDDQ